MIYYNLFIGILIVLCYLIIVSIINKNRNFTTFDKLIHIVLSIYISFLVKFMIFPIPINEKLYGLSNNYIPLVNIFKNINESLYTVLYNMVLGNLITFIPIGFFIAFLIKDNISLKKILTIGFIISASKETLQLLISIIIQYNYKSFDIDCILLSFIGYFIGYAFYNLFVLLIRKTSSSIQ